MIDFEKVISGAKFQPIRETGWAQYHDPDMMGGEFALVAENGDYAIFLGSEGYQIQDPETLEVFFFDFDGIPLN